MQYAKRFVMAAMLAVMALGTSGCFTRGERKELVLTLKAPDQHGGVKTVTLTDSLQDTQVMAFMVAPGSAEFNYRYMGTKLSPLQEESLEKVTEHCRETVDIVHPSNLVAIGTETGLMGVLGAAGLAGGSQALPGNIGVPGMAGYGAGAAGFMAAGNATVKIGAKLQTFDGCGAGVYRRVPELGIEILQNNAP